MEMTLEWQKLNAFLERSLSDRNPLKAGFELRQTKRYDGNQSKNQPNLRRNSVLKEWEKVNKQQSI